jgi:hypothetical protein
MLEPLDGQPAEKPSAGRLWTEEHALRHARLQSQILRAGEQARQVAYAELRDQVRMELGAPSEPSRGTGDCLAVVLVPLGLILMLVHPAPAIAVWAMAAVLYLAGSNQLQRERAAMRAADAETERRWRRQQGQASSTEV